MRYNYKYHNYQPLKKEVTRNYVVNLSVPVPAGIDYTRMNDIHSAIEELRARIYKAEYYGLKRVQLENAVEVFQHAEKFETSRLVSITWQGGGFMLIRISFFDFQEMITFKEKCRKL